MDRFTEWIGSHGSGLSGKDCYTKLAEYEDLEEQGRLLKLPINPKTKIYSIEYCCGENKNNKTGMCIRGFCSECEIKTRYILEATAESSCKISEIGKTVFLTREEAEAALKELETRKMEAKGLEPLASR